MVEDTQGATVTAAKNELAAQVWRFEQLVSEHSNRLRRIELLLDEIAAEDTPVKHGN